MYKYDDYWTEGQTMSWFHDKIKRVLHDEQNYTKRYITNEELIELCSKPFVIQEKVDGKQSCNSYPYAGMKITEIYEDMTNKNTCHNHVMEYNMLPPEKKIKLETIIQKPNEEPFVFSHNSKLNYAVVSLDNPTLDEIYTLLETFSKMRSHYGSNEIEGLVLKTYLKDYSYDDILEKKVKVPEVSFAKWVNQKFEDKVHGVE